MHKTLLPILTATTLACHALVAAPADPTKSGSPAATPGQSAHPASEDALTDPSATKSDKAGVQSRAPEPMNGTLFAERAAFGGITEVELGKIAATHASSSAVKRFAAMMVTDHTRLGQELQAIATKEKIEIPAKLDTNHQKKVDKLAALDGPAFDQAYVAAMVKGHEKTIALFEKAAVTCSNADLKKFALAALPTLKHHLKEITAIQKAL